MKSQLSIFIILIVGFTQVALGEDFAIHLKRIENAKVQLELLKDEMKKNMSAKRKTHDSRRVQDILDRIAELHSEKLVQESILDKEREEVFKDHPEEGKRWVEAEEKKGENVQALKPRDSQSIMAERIPASEEMDVLFEKIQSKYANFLAEEDRQKDRLENVHSVEERHRKRRKAKEDADYLRRRSKIKITK